MAKNARKTVKKWLTSDRRIQLIAFVVGFGVIGTIALILSSAATPNVVLESESGTPSGGAVIKTDDPTASGGKYLQFSGAAIVMLPPANIQAPTIGANQVVLSWTTSLGAAGYQVSRNGVVLGTSTTNTYTDTTVAPATQYSYTVKSYNSTNAFSVASTAISVNTPPSTPPPTGLLNWSNAASWANGRVPAANEVVTIPADKKILLDIDAPKLKGLIINGELHFKDRATTFRSGYINVYGKLIIGTETTPLLSNITIKLDGAPSDTQTVGVDNVNIGANVLAAINTGVVDIHGEDTGSTWTTLAATANAGVTTITLTNAVAWKVGSTITIASSTTDQFQAERATITNISADKKTITLAAALKNRHTSVVTSLTSGGETRSVSEKAEVGLLSHNIKITGPDNASQTLFGGHVMTLKGAVMRLSNIQMYAMGQLGILARYPLHWHLNGDASASYVNNISVHDSFNRFLSAHRTDNLRVTGMVGDTTFGHAIITEDGVEKGNVFTKNLIMGVRRPPDDANIAAKKAANPGIPICTPGNPTTLFHGNTKPANSSCHVRASDDLSSGFWLASVDNTLIGNSAAGSDGVGIWYDLNFNSDNTCLIAPETLPAAFQDDCQQNLFEPFGDSIDNIAHSHRYPCGSGNAESQAVCGNTSSIRFSNNCISTGICVENYVGNVSAFAKMNNPTTWMNEGAGIWLDGAITVSNPMTANNGGGIQNQSSAVQGGIVIGDGTATTGGHSNAVGWLLNFYHGGGHFNGTWLGGYATYADTKPDIPRAAIVDYAVGAFDYDNRVNGLKFFDNQPNINSSPISASYRVAYNNGCNFAEYNGGYSTQSGAHWFHDMDGSVLGNGVPATITNNRAMLRPVTAYETNPPANENPCGGALPINGGKPTRTGGFKLLYPKQISNSGTPDGGFYIPGIQPIFKISHTPIASLSRDQDGMTGGWNDWGSMAKNARYRLKNDGDTAFNSFSSTFQDSYPGSYFEIYFKWSPSTANVTYDGKTLPAVSSLSALSSANSAIFLNNANDLLYIRINLQGTDKAFMKPHDDRGFRMNGQPIGGYVYLRANP